MIWRYFERALTAFRHPHEAIGSAEFCAPIAGNPQAGQRNGSPGYSFQAVRILIWDYIWLVGVIRFGAMLFVAGELMVFIALVSIMPVAMLFIDG